MSRTDTHPADGDTAPYISLLSIRDRHKELLQMRRQEEDPAFYPAVTEFMRRAQSSGRYLDDDQERWAVQNLIDYWDNQLFHANIPSPPEILLAEFDPYTEPEIPDDKCPYVGLGTFTISDGPYFFGREDLINDLWQQVQAHRLVAVLGPSGSGKSSVVLAGLLPRLRQGALPGSQLWHIYPAIVPGSAPLTHLTALLQPPDVDLVAWTDDNLEHFQTNPDHLANIINQANETTAVLVIDQFEELFTLCQDEGEREAYLANLLHLVQSSAQRHSLIITMRTDYESQLNKYPAFQAQVAQSLTRVSAMNAGELRDAIEKPADLIGLKFEAGLVDALIREILGEPAALPLLQFALLKLWENRERSRITWEAYRRIGGVLAALEITAEALYNSMIPEDQITTRRIMMRLVQPSQGLEVTRNRVRRRVLYQAGEAQDRVDRVLEKLIAAQLIHYAQGVIPQDDQLEVAHEALVRNWPRLVEWLDEERIHLRQRHRLTAQAENWADNNENNDLLLRGPALTEAQQFQDYNQLEERYINASLVEKKRLEEKEARVRQRERRFSLMLALFAIVAIAVVLLLFRSNQASIVAKATADFSQIQALSAELTAQAIAVRSTRDVAMANATSTVAVSTATAQAGVIETSQAQSEFRLTADAQTTSEAIWATSTFQAEVVATATAVGAATATRAAESSRPTPTPNLNQTLGQYQENALLSAFFRSQDNMPMLFITGNSFMMGGLPNDPDKRENELPLHRVTVPNFYLDAYEVSVQQYAAFLNDIGGYRNKCGNGRFPCVATGFETSYTMLLNNVGVYEPKAGYGAYPINWVTWYGAHDYCQWAGARLPTEAEWEYAARAINERLYPWGSVPAPNNRLALFNVSPRGVDFFQTIRPVDAFAEGAGAFGNRNLAGSMWEWVEDWYAPNYQNTPTDGSPFLDNSSGQKVARGGGWTSPAADLRTSRRLALAPTFTNTESSLLYWSVGFRCATDIAP
jgi:formylglycine-generating enzyme required for sulfatase activity/energy-coupling factor transporter ATP-binding protein EcfA2